MRRSWGCSCLEVKGRETPRSSRQDARPSPRSDQHFTTVTDEAHALEALASPARAGSFHGKFATFIGGCTAPLMFAFAESEHWRRHEFHRNYGRFHNGELAAGRSAYDNSFIPASAAAFWSNVNVCTAPSSDAISAMRTSANSTDRFD